MSSLAGWWGRDVVSPAVLDAMAHCMSGPDPQVEEYVSEDFAAVTVRPRVAGPGAYIAQSGDGATVVVFSGYLYTENDQERRDPALHCLALYQRLGSRFARELNGSFSVVVLDRKRSRLLLVTDRLSSRALYYSVQRDLVFANEVKAILHYPGISRKPNPDRLREFLILGSVPGLETYYEHVRQVPAASVMSWEGGCARISSYWQPRFEWGDGADLGELAQRMLSAIEGAVRRSCTGAGNVALMLSGGLDSRAIAATAKCDLLCITLHSMECYEVVTARRVARALGYEHMFVALARDYPLELLRGGALTGDGMHVYTNAQPLTLARALQARGVDRLLNGWMLDVPFSGLCLPAKSVSIAGKTLLLPVLVPEATFDVVQGFIEAHQVESPGTLGALLGEQTARDAFELTKTHIASIAAAQSAYVRNKYDAADWLEVLGNAVKQADYLNVLAIDRLVPAAIPSHDNEIMDLYLRMPPYARFNQRVYSRFFHLLGRELAKIPYTSVGGPITNCVWWNWARTWWRKARREMCSAVNRRLGIGDTEAHWSSWPEVGEAMRNVPEWHTCLRAYLKTSRLIDLGVVRADGLRTLIDEHLSGRRNHTQLLGTWLTLEEWLNHYG